MEDPMRLLAALTALVLALQLTTARAEEPATAIQSVIEQQLDAFQNSDVTAAFSHASPSIQQIFKDPKTFGRMVEFSYPMVWRPRRHEMRQLVETESGPVQVVLFEDAAGRLHEAGYLMQQIDGRWRINGVKLRLLPSVGT